jgi:hypothetical protein
MLYNIISSYFERAYTQSDIVTIGYDREWANAAPSACKLQFLSSEKPHS